MHIKDQIVNQKSAKGQKEFYIDSAESVDWFIQKHVDPTYNKSGFQKHLRDKQDLQAQGMMPKSQDELTSHLKMERDTGKHLVHLEKDEKLVGYDISDKIIEKSSK